MSQYARWYKIRDPEPEDPKIVVLTDLPSTLNDELKLDKHWLCIGDGWNALAYRLKGYKAIELE